MELTPRIQRRIEAMFIPSELHEATHILEQECGEKVPFFETLGVPGVERVRAAALKLADGSLEQLWHYAKMAQIDWRDVLMAAEFGNDVKSHLVWLDDANVR